jgi:hypothetical protein
MESSLLSALWIARSTQVSAGRGLCRRSTATSWRSKGQCAEIEELTVAWLAAGQLGWVLVSSPLSWAERTAVRRLLTPSLV